MGPDQPPTKLRLAPEAQPAKSIESITLPLEYVRALYNAVGALTDILEGPLNGANVEVACKALKIADVAEDYVADELLKKIEPTRAF